MIGTMRVGSKGRLSEAASGYLFVAPALLIVALLALVPILTAMWLSLYRHLPIFGITEFVGLRNYLALWSDQRFWSACATTLYFTGVSVGAELLLGLGIALLLDQPWNAAGKEQTEAERWLRVVMLIPWTVPTVVSARMWEWLYQTDYGLLNHLLMTAGVIEGPVNWLGHPYWALHAAIAMDVWKATPFAALLLLAGLKAIPPDLYRAARVDGASRWSIFRHITLPLLLPVMLVVLAFRTMDAFRVFDAVYVLTGGGPGNSTETLSIYTYDVLFQTLRFGYGSALASVIFAMILMLTAASFIVMRRRLHAVV